MGAPLLLLTVMGLLAAAIVSVLAWRNGWTALMRFAVGGALVWLGVYFALLLYFSLSSKEKTLAFNEPKEFCGFYLDCHLHAAVTEVKKLKTIEPQTARGLFYVVQVKVFSDAQRATIGLLKPYARIKAADGLTYERDAAAEAAWEKANGPSVPLDKIVGPQGDSFSKTIVFDVPDDASQPRLQITEGYWIDAVLETVIIGDEDSLLHQRAKFSLDTSTVTARQNY